MESKHKCAAGYEPTAYPAVVFQLAQGEKNEPVSLIKVFYLIITDMMNEGIFAAFGQSMFELIGNQRIKR
jgi:hypothetical protein